MKGQPQDKLWYEIVPIGLDLLCDQSCDLMILQLPFFLDASSNKRVTFEIIALVGKNLLNLVGNWEKNHVYSINEKISLIRGKNKEENRGVNR